MVRWLLLVLLMTVPLVGCGRKRETTVVGKVTMDGRTLAKGEIKFFLVGGGASAYGGIQPDGTYEVRAPGGQEIVPGNYAVTVVAKDLLPPDSRTRLPGSKLITPRRYGDAKTTDLQCTVNLGENPLDFNLVP